MKHLEINKHEIVKDYTDGLPITRLSTKWGCSPKTMRNKLKEWGVHKPSKRGGRR